MDAKVPIGSGHIPLVGLGTYLCSDDTACEAVKHALQHGYRHIDTAEFYANQRGIAEGIKQSGVQREDIFITDKLGPGGIFGQPGKTYQETIDSCKKALDLLQTSYLDLYLIHHPGAVAERLDQWRALIDLQSQGLVKHIGVSNYSIKHLEEIKSAGLRSPDANQIEVHPLCTQVELIAYMRENSITPIAYSSLAPASTWRVEEGQSSGKTSQHNSHLATVSAMTAKYGISEAQLLLKWALQHDMPIIPKSCHASRIEQNAQLFHFSLDDADMQTLDGLDQNLALAWPIGNPLDWN